MTKNMTKYLLEYMKVHLISLQQDLDELSRKMEGLDPASKDFTDLDFEYNWINGNIAGVMHILGVAEREMNK